MTEEQYWSDFDQALNFLMDTHPDLFRNCSKEEFDFAVKEEKMSSIFDTSHLLKSLSRIYSLIEDGHTRIYPSFSLPVRFSLIEDNLYIVNHAFQTDLTGIMFEKIEKIQDLTVSELLCRMAPFLCHENKETLEASFLMALEDPFLLRSLGIISDTYYIITNRQKIDLLQAKVSEPLMWKQTVPLHRQEFYDDKTYYIKYGRCYDSKSVSVDSFFQKCISDIDQFDVSRLVVDLRGNTGGDSSLISPLIRFLTHYKENHSLEIVTLIDRFVMSSGTFAIMDLKELGSLFVGEIPQGRVNHFGFPRVQELKNSHFILSCSQFEWFYTNHDYRKLNQDNLIHLSFLERQQLEKREPVIPDLLVHNSIEDVMIGNDRVLMTALSNECLQKNKKQI